MDLNATFKFISLASMLTAAAASRAQSLNSRGIPDIPAEQFPEFLRGVTSAKDSLTKRMVVDSYFEKVKVRGRAVIEDTMVYFIYHGKAKRIGVPSDLNSWDASADTMKRVEGTDFFFLAKSVHEAARFEYKLVVDSLWVLDPVNRQQAFGGYGPNSEIWMPHYSSPKEIEYRPDIAHGTVDTMSFKSSLLGRTHPVFVYLPPGYKNTRNRFPCIYVTDGGEYISLALMLNVLDNLIDEQRIEPVAGIFIDPRTDVRDSQTSKRVFDYSMSDTFVNALLRELRPRLMKKYRLTARPDQTAIMGASLGGLISTYAAYQHPEVFGLCAAQSPSYWLRDGRIFNIIETGPKKPIKFYIDTGTIRDAQPQALKMKNLLSSKGYEVAYGEYPEGHNWANWRARLDEILTFFWGRKQ